MTAPQTATEIYQAYRDFGSVGMPKRPTRDQVMERISLPEWRKWLNPSKVHPLLLKVYEDVLNRTHCRLNFGRSDEGTYLSFETQDYVELVRVTIAAKKPIYKTDEKGLWFLGSDEHDIPPTPAAELAKGLSGKLWDVLKILQVEGQDGDADIAHVGTYVEQSRVEPSTIKALFVVGNRYWTIQTRSKHMDTTATFNRMIHLLRDEVEELEDHVSLTWMDPHAGVRVGAIYDPTDAGNCSEMLPEDALVEVREHYMSDARTPQISYVKSQVDNVRSQLKMLSDTIDHPVVAGVARSLGQYVGQMHVFQLINAPDQPFVSALFYDLDNHQMVMVRLPRPLKP